MLPSAIGRIVVAITEFRRGEMASGGTVTMPKMPLFQTLRVVDRTRGGTSCLGPSKVHFILTVAFLNHSHE